jgi:hypothetical protein
MDTSVINGQIVSYGQRYPIEYPTDGQTFLVVRA